MHKYNMLYTIKLIEHVLTPESVIGNFVPITKKRSAGMRTVAYNADVASDRRRRKNATRHILAPKMKE